MATRGRPPKDEARRRSVALGIRITPDLREQLDTARRNGEVERSLGQEIELRLRQSFESGESDNIIERFHSPRNYYVGRLIANGITEWIEKYTGKSVWRDPYTFDEFKVFVSELLNYLRPKGKGAKPNWPLDRGPNPFPKKGDYGEWVATVLIRELQINAKNYDLPIGVSGLVRKASANIVTNKPALFGWLDEEESTK